MPAVSATRSLQAALLGVGLAAVGWRGLAQPPLDVRGLGRLGAPPGAERADVAQTLQARWASAERFGLFPAAGAAQAAPNSGSLRLQGTAFGPGRRAALISVGGAKAMWLAPGEPAQGLELVELSAGRAVVKTSSGEEVTLFVFDPAHPPAPESTNPNASQ